MASSASLCFVVSNELVWNGGHCWSITLKFLPFHDFLATEEVVGEIGVAITGHCCKFHVYHGNWVIAALSSWPSLKAV